MNNVALENLSFARYATPLATPDGFSPSSRLGRRVAELVLSSTGCISQADAGAAEIFGYSDELIIGLHVSCLLPRLTEAAFADDSAYRHLVYLSHCGAVFNGCRSNSESFACTISLIQQDAPTGLRLRLLVCVVEDSRALYRL